ncbi:type I 3-dehydroquinate dehydratase [Lactobacillus delbrueckii subsp. allosunkii]|mgnify:FL=1|uniref:3-dehydroquinate dehydratase n=1 Tax=Lactobacillus delbrueckii subsp. allosunkii TaxID=1050107 RepID=A0ABD4SBQ4_9LACO|nr:type I 3-dehydroquinate dehydratase [Lactobacillus delbrueckii]MCD5517919.1 type I 3-dehydroquinate dehydratase [Lactobacillus delbrueckii subsp. sunkii]MCT3476409.1 type I 3-dehydroquinate dehydratase [Lactobacillus delbrueckii subsp. lactis]MCZ0777490.1 type I 3-dehydroquinate dehydratase [Lactobacillus delbrueckii subsp. sunkii]MCZ0788870.1 type I 3-dehydroquinate dehydratase [Lactobacillus delbrueckii subsp. sunkii]MCZ0794669.1 type I 3-dehydroquinate dehydratase [Lactobacillus delbruec
MTTVKVRNIVLGEGLPKIAVPNVGVTEEEILASAKEIAAAKPDIMEWRIDYYEAGIMDNEKLIATAKALRDVVGELPILVTFRTKNEGGVLELGEDEYLDLVATVVTNRLGDAVDIELFHYEERVKDLVKQAHNYNVVVIMSNHDFEKVPAKDVIEFRLKKMADLGADVPKLACMPHSADDVLTLLSATNDARKALSTPIITMAMADLGKVSRIAGQVFGSCLSFGAVGKTSAPGQLSIKDLRNAENYLELH